MTDEVLTFSSENKKGIVAERELPADNDSDILSLRPEKFADYVGQPETVETLEIAIKAAKKRNEPLDHILFYGPPGLGKTTMAHIIANEMESNITVTSGPALEKGLEGALKEATEGMAEKLATTLSRALRETLEETLKETVPE